MDGPLSFLDHVSYITWQTCVAHLLSDHKTSGNERQDEWRVAQCRAVAQAAQALRYKRKRLDTSAVWRRLRGFRGHRDQVVISEQPLVS